MIWYGTQTLRTNNIGLSGNNHLDLRCEIGRENASKVTEKWQRKGGKGYHGRWLFAEEEI